MEKVLLMFLKINMKFTIYIIGFALIALCFSGCGKTPEQIQAQALLEQQRWQMQQEQAKAAHERQVELMNTPGWAEAQQLELAQQQADSLEYLETSRQVHDVIDAVQIGAGILSIIAE